jgi:PhoH-like ATPase
LKTFILDTNILLDNPESLFEFKNSHVVLPFIVLRELDAKKTRSDIVGRNARQANRLLETLRMKGSLQKGVMHNGTLFQVKDTQHIVADNNDEKILKLALEIIEPLESPDNVKLITNDISLRLSADAQGVPSEPLDARMCDSIDGWVQTEKVDEEIINRLHMQGAVDAEDVFTDFTPVANTCFIFKSETSGSVLARFKRSTNKFHTVVDMKDVWGIKPKNKEQRFAFDILFDDDIKLVVLIGCAGTGKTLLGTAAGIRSTIGKTAKGKKTYKKFIVTRPIVPLGNDLGYLPGTFEEKMSPWIAPIHDNLDVLFKSKAAKQMLAKYLDDGSIEVEAVTYIRGRSIQDSFFIIDEAQNLTIDELKAIVTRAGHGTKIVLTGDIEQIDNKHMNVHSNGLLTLVDRFFDEDICGVVKLEKSERSKLAEKAAKLL